jgi:hypothetical protein
MKINYTTKLYFDKFSIRMQVETIGAGSSRWNNNYWGYTVNKMLELQELSAWCRENLKKQHYKLIDRYGRKGELPNTIVFNQMLYLFSQDQANAVIAEFGSRVVEITQPKDQFHLEQLEVKNEVVYRNTLLYKKYQHVVYFKYDRYLEVWNWLQDYAADETDLKIDKGYYCPRVYMENEDHLAVFKLTWGERIDYIKTICLI